MTRTALALVVLAALAAPARADTSHVLYLNRCIGDCTIHSGNSNSSQTDTSWFVGDELTYTLSEFVWGDAVWQQIVDCVRDVYAPYDIEVTDVDPGSVVHDEIYCAGDDAEVGISGSGGVGGPKSPSAYCETGTNNVSFAFLNGYDPTQIEYMCGVITQETGHSFALDDHIADCRDPMSFSYHGPCGGTPRGFFRDHFASCANVGSSQCICGGSKVNDHQKLIGALGPNPDFDPAAPTMTILSPADGAVVDETVTFGVEATAHRGIYGVDLYLNGWPWGTWQAPESPSFGDPWPIDQMVVDPDNGFPDGVYDAELRAYDDLGTTASQTITIRKGAPCTSADSCLDGQKCEDGKCFWDQPSGALGDACEFDQQCIGPNVYDGQCESDICTHACFAGPNDNCGEGFECASTNDDGSGVCMPATADKPGCCSSGGGSGGLVLVGFVGLVLVGRRRAAPAVVLVLLLGARVAAAETTATSSIAQLLVLEDGDKNYKAYHGALWLEYDKADHNYRWGGQQCKGHDLSASSLEILFAAFKSDYQVTLEYVASTYKSKTYRCITGFTISKS